MSATPAELNIAAAARRRGPAGQRVWLADLARDFVGVDAADLAAGLMGAERAGLLALMLGLLFLRKAYDLKQCPCDRDLARGVFKYSIFYMMLLSAARLIRAWLPGASTTEVASGRMTSMVSFALAATTQGV